MAPQPGEAGIAEIGHVGDPLVALEQGEPRGAGQGDGQHRGPDRLESRGVLARPGRAGARDALREVGGLAQIEGEEAQDGQGDDRGLQAGFGIGHGVKGDGVFDALHCVGKCRRRGVGNDNVVEVGV